MAQTIVGSGDIFPDHPANWERAVDMVIGDTASGTLRISDGAPLNNTHGVVGKDASATGTVYVSGPGSRWSLDQTLSIGDEGTGTLNLWNYGRVQVLGSGTVSLAKAATATGTINIGATPGAAPAASGQLLAKEVFFGAGTAKLNFNTNSVVDFAASLRSDSSGIHELNQYSGTTRLLANSTDFLGKINVTGGELQILDKLGSGESTISGAAIPATVTVDGLNAVWANSGNLFVGKTSTGALAVTNGAQVNNLFGTVSALQNGPAQVTVSGGGAVWRNSHALSVGTQGGQGKVSVEAGGSLFSADAYLGSNTSGVGTVSVAGSGSSWHNDGALRVGDLSGQGSLSVSAGGVVSNRGAFIASMGGTGKVTVTGTGSEWSSTAPVYIGYGVGAANGTLTIADGGTVTAGVAGSLAAVELVSNAFPFPPSTATLNIGGEVGSAAVRAGTLNAAEITFGAGIASLNFNHTDTELKFAPGVRSVGAGQHRLNQVAGTTVLTGNSAGFTGKTTVSGGKLVVLDTLGGWADVSGGTLQYGDGIIGAANLLSGNLSVAGNLGTLSIQGPATLQVMGDLTMADNTLLAVGTGTAGPALQAVSMSVGDGTVLNLSGIADESQLGKVLIATQGGIQGDFTTVNVSGFTSAVDYLTVHTGKSADNRQYLATYDLSWTAKNNLRHGTFTLAQSTDLFNVGAALGDQTANAATGWNGTTLTKAGAGTLALDGDNTYTGGTEIRQGTLLVSKDANLGAASTALAMTGGTLATRGSFSSNRQISLLQNGTLDVASGTKLDWTGVITGGGDLIKQGAGTLVLTGANTYGTTRVQAGALIGNSTSIRGDLHNDGTVIFDQAWNGSVSGALIGTGAIAKRGAGILTLNGLNTLNWNIEAGTLASDVSRYTANATIGAAGTLRFDQATDADYAGKVSGSGTFEKTGAGALRLNADNSAFTGTTRVSSGTLVVANKLGGNAEVSSGRLHVTGTLSGNAAIGNNVILSGTGTVGQNVTLTGGVLQGTQGSTLKVGGNLTLDNASRVNVALGSTASAALFDVGGDLALAGTLNVAEQGAFGAGVYRLFDYGGALTANTLALGTVPTGITANDLRLQTAVAGQVNLMSTFGTTLSFWDGGNAAQRDNGVIDGGLGVWRTDALNWTNEDGTLNGRFQPNPTYAVFQGAPGIVEVDATAGGVGVAGMQFSSGGYRVQGDAIALDGANGETVVRVGSGLAIGAATTATLASSLTGASKLVKADFGTLVLAGNNTYTGGTEVRTGTLSVSTDANLGASAGALTLNGGALATTASFDSARAVTLAQTADINVAAGTTLDLQGAVSGAGTLQKLGTGTLTLTGANTYGSTQVLAGTLVGNAASIRGDLLNHGAVVFNQATDATYAGYVSGTGTMAKQGTGVLTLTGVNAQDWRIDAGTLAVSAGRYTSNTTIASGAEVRFNQASSTSFSGALAGAGLVTKTGTGMLQLLGDNSSFAGRTQVQTGMLGVSDKLGGSASVTGGRLHTDGVLGGDVTASGAGILSGAGRINGNATLTGGVLEGVQGQTLVFGGDLSLSSASRVNVELGNASGAALFSVADNLTLAGSLNITDQGGFGAGVYRLFDYGGSLTNHGLAIGTTPVGVSASALTLQTAVGGQVNLASTSGATLSFWDGGNTAGHDNGAIDGGSGTWRADGRNWANVDGTLNGSFQPNPTFAVFQGTAGTVTVDTSAGALGVTGLRIAADGYRIEGDAIALQGAGGESIIRVGSGSTADAGMVGTIAASLTGASKLVKTDAGMLTLTGDNTYTGGTDIQFGTLSISADNNLGAANTGVAMAGGSLATTASFNTTRNISLMQDGAINVATGTQLGLTGTVSGGGALIKQGAGTLALTGANTYGSTRVRAGTLIGNSASIRGDLHNDGTVIFDQAWDDSVSGALIGTGAIAKRGAGILTLNGLNTLNWNIEAGTLASDVTRYTANATIGAAGTLRFDQATDADYAGKISGSGTFEKTGAGALRLNADSSAFTGTTRVANGTLVVANTLGGNAEVSSGRLHVTGTLSGNAAIGNNVILSGTGTIGQNVTLAGGVLQGTQGSTLKVGGNLTLDNASRVNVALGRAASNTLFDVGGNLALAGTLNITDQGAFGAGVYRLFDYRGALTSNTLAIGTAPTGITADDLRIQTAVNGQVNLMSTAGATLSFWDGSDPARRDDGVIDGGSGTWRTDGLNWTNEDGTLNGRFQPNPTYAVFQGASGIVEVDAGAGAVGVTGMQITSNGYRVEGDSIELAGGAETSLRVGSGNSSGTATTGTIASRLTGASKLVKADFGTLVLAGNNTYTGGTEIRTGTLSVSTDANLGASAGALTLNGGALATTASFDSARAVTLAQTADINVAAGTTLGLQGHIGGTGNLQKLGTGTLTLTGTNTYGNTQVLAGTLVGNAASIRGDLLNHGAVVFNQATDATYAGYVSGTGTMAKQGAGVLTLTGVNAQDWRIDAGTLAVSAGRYTSNTTIASGAEVRFNQASSTSFSGALAGAGQVTKTGAGMLQLLGDNSSFAGRTQVQSGMLWVSDKLGGSASVTGGRLHTDGVLGGDVTASGAGILSGAGRINGNATLTGGVLEGVQGQTLAVGGDLSLSGASQVNVELGNASGTALFTVADDLTLAGSLNITDQGGFGAGVYRLFDYGGSLTNHGLAIGTTPVGVSASALTLQTAVGGRVNLASTSGATLSFWDGGNAAGHDNGAIDGGSGMWRADGRNWANVDGTLNGVFQPKPTFAVFQGTAGTVTVDTSAGAIGVTGMQIATDGYRIEGDAIALQGAGGESIIRVGSGSTADAGMVGTIAARLTGASKLVKTDFGTLVLAGDNTYSGGTEVRAGVLSVARDANLGAAAGGLTLNGGTLSTSASFETARSVMLAQSSRIAVASGTNFGLTGSVTGNGDLAKTGAGTLTVSGDGSAYTGSLLVQAGALNVASTGELGGTLTLASGTLLQGAGQVGSTTLQNGATLAPGNVAGALNVAGDLTFMPGSVYQVAADPASSASARVAVSGVANLAGSVVHVGPEGGFDTTRQYTILSAGAINGQFDNVSSNYAYLDPALRYGAQDVMLQLGRKQVPVNPVNPADPGTRPITFADAAQTANQRAVANALETLPLGNALQEFILTLPNGAPPAVFNNLSGEAHASVASSLMGASTTTRTLPLSYLRANLNAGMRPGAPTAQAGGTLSASALPSSNAQPAWAELVGNWQTQKATGNTAQVRQHIGGVFVGADHAVGDGWRVGGAVGYTDSKIRVDDRASQADVSGYSAAIYGGKAFEAGAGKLNWLVGTSYTWHDVSTERSATVAGASQKLTADYGASTTQVFTELGYALPLADRATIEPFAGLAWSDLRTRSFSESGGSAALRGQSSNNQQTTSTLGVRAQTDFTLAGAEGRLQATLGWRHAFGDVLPQTRMAFDGGQAFTVSGSPIARNAALAELGAEVAVSRNASVGVNYSGQYGGGNREHAGSLNVRWRY
jgi:T5SS/PEP-CTERM-associated repeat protein/autotransporter-associated beta strand protein